MEEGNKKIIVAIDGPGGSGKTTVSREVARRLGYVYLSTGALYRAVALKVDEEKVDPKDERRLGDLIGQSKIKISPTEQGNRTILDGRDVSDKLNDPHISMLASSISALPLVRK